MFKTLLLVNFRGVKRILIFDFVTFQKLGEFIRFSSDFQILLNFHQKKIRRRMARERRGAESSVASMDTLYYKTIY
jgi:hypothetical protein